MIEKMVPSTHIVDGRSNGVPTGSVFNEPPVEALEKSEFDQAEEDEAAVLEIPVQSAPFGQHSSSAFSIKR